MAGLLKHQAFHHEREWRFVLTISPGKDKSTLAHPIRLRSTAAGQVPYIEFPLTACLISEACATALSPALLPISDVMLGPGTGGSAIDEVNEFLRSRAVAIA